MKIKYYNFFILFIWRNVLRYIYFIFSGVSFGSGKIFYQYHPPIWVYVATIVISIIFLFLGFHNIFYPSPSVGKILFTEKKIEIKGWFRKRIFDINALQNISLTYDFENDKIYMKKCNMFLFFEANNFNKKYNISVSDSEEESLKKLLDPQPGE